MKNHTLILLLVAMTIVGCNKHNRNEDIQYNFNELPLAEEPSEFISTKEISDSLLGDFDGDGLVDTACLWRYSSPNDVYCKIDFNHQSLTDIISYGNIIFMENEGDINGDNSDEIGYFAQEDISYWGYYNVNCFRDGRWQTIVSLRYNGDIDNLLMEQGTSERSNLVQPLRDSIGYIKTKQIEVEYKVSEEKLFDISIIRNDNWFWKEQIISSEDMISIDNFCK